MLGLQSLVVGLKAMIFSPRRFAVAVAASLAVLAPAALVWACVGVVALTNSNQTVQPGGTLSVTGREFAQAVPIAIHLDSPTGPVLATVPPLDATMNSKFTVSVPIPANIANGEHFLVATQNHHDMNSGAPARTVFYVGTAPPAAAAAAARPVGMTTASGPSSASLLLIGFGAAALGLLAAGLWVFLSARAATPLAEPVKGDAR